jgi:hypothetical protein
MWLYLDTSDQSHTAKSIPIVKQSSFLEWPLEIYQKRLSGTIYEPFQERIYVSLSTLLSAGSRNHARISALQDLERVWQESEADCFMRSLGCVARLSQDLSFWKMSQPSLLEAEPKWSERLPKWGMIVDGALYPLRPLEHCTKGNDGSYWQDQMWPTPKALDWKDKGTEPSLMKRDSPGLPAIVMNQYMATPTASQANKPIREPSPSRQKGEHGEDLQDSIGRLNPENIGKRLCPRWVSVLMGFPTWWTDLSPLETQSCPNKLEKLLKY